MSDDVRTAYLVGRLDRVLRRQLEEGLRQHGVTVVQFTALSVLRVRSGMSNAQLARRSLVTPQSMGEVVTALENKGLVKRLPHPSHGRIMLTELTPAGEAMLVDCARVVDRAEGQMLEGLSARDQERFRSYLSRCARMLGAGPANP